MKHILLFISILLAFVQTSTARTTADEPRSCSEAARLIQEKCLKPAGTRTSLSGSPSFSGIDDAATLASGMATAGAQRNQALSRKCEDLATKCKPLCEKENRPQICDRATQMARTLNGGAQGNTQGANNANNTGKSGQDQGGQQGGGGGGMPPMQPPTEQAKEEQKCSTVTDQINGRQRELCSESDVAAYESQLKKKKEDDAKLARRPGDSTATTVNRTALLAPAEAKASVELGSAEGGVGSYIPYRNAQAQNPETEESLIPNSQLAKIILEQKDGNQFMFSVEQRKTVIKRMIASHQFCEADEEIKSLQQTDVEGQQAAMELSVFLDHELEREDRPPGEFGLSLLCQQ